MQIGVVGLGRMGTAMVHRVLACGGEVVGWNRSLRPIEGMTLARSLAELSEAAEVIILSLHDGDAVRAVCAALAVAGVDSKLVIDTSTVTPQTSAKGLEIITRAGGRFVDAPVLGTVGPCTRGELVAMVGGADEDFEFARKALAPLTRAIHHMGPVGSGAATKLSINLVMGSYWAALGDALALATAYAIEPTRLIDIIEGGPAALGQLAAKRPVLEGRQDRVDFSLASYVKDLTAMVDAAGPNMQLPVLEGVLASFQGAHAGGWGDRDVVSVALHAAAKSKNAQSYAV